MSVLTNIANEIGRIQNAKEDIANAINAKGVTVPSTAKLDEYPGFVNLIPSGSTPGRIVAEYANDSLDQLFNNAKGLLGADLSAASGVTSMVNTFAGCANLINAPVIPSSVTNMYCTFSACVNLASAPMIPSGVTSMYSTFRTCYKLTAAPVIPSQVTNMAYTFEYCHNLASVPAIPNNVTSMKNTFGSCGNLISAPLIGENVTTMDYCFYNCVNLAGDIHIASRNVGTCNNCFSGTTAAKSVYTRGRTFDTFNALYGAGQNGVTMIQLYDWNKYLQDGTLTSGDSGYDTGVISYSNKNTSTAYYNASNSTNRNSAQNRTSTVYWSSSLTVNQVESGRFDLENTLSVSYTNYSRLANLRGKYFSTVNAHPNMVYYANPSATYSRSNNSNSKTYYTYINVERNYTNPVYAPTTYTGTYVGSVNSTDSAAYPAAGAQDGYFFVSLDN